MEVGAHGAAVVVVTTPRHAINTCRRVQSADTTTWKNNLENEQTIEKKRGGQTLNMPRDKKDHVLFEK